MFRDIACCFLKGKDRYSSVGRAAVLSHTVRQQYMDRNGLAAMLAADVTPEVNLRTSLPTGDEAHK